MNNQLVNAIKQNAKHLKEPDDFLVVIEEIDQQKYVLLGESSHGTSEFYTIRADLTKKLIVEKGFHFIAVEGDWPACQQVNRYIKGFDQASANARDVLTSFNRWPTWMWANEEMISLIEWLKEYNQTQPKDKQVGFYGIDIYSLWESMDEILKYLVKTNSPLAQSTRNAFSCFEPFNRHPEKYAVAASFYSEGCHDEVFKLLTEIRLHKKHFSNTEESHLNIEVNAIVTANAEKYYRTMVVDDNESWNIRDRHMVEVINKISDWYGSDAKGIIWEHNTHVGDARATDMVKEGIENVGQLLREQIGKEKLFIIGFGTHRGTVIAADEWGVNLERMIIPPAIAGSFEDAMHKAGPHDKLLVFNEQNKHHFQQTIGHRAIGVVYDPQYEQYGNYVPSVMSKRYDAFIYVNYTNGLTPLVVEEVIL
ncbi:erythromycin esterase family protein [Metabacillus sediminilitoris]|uniref:Erythromycin esterase family protein n=1 Tax=Metabacillus sediminilitoris TaxID=2567941 RepID=A0A4S4C597_9BACI|nr:erythromycin esterase family protein [Metabacillus sediminilitoris]QGQ45299.1 erythromycin esterase family protein [Metabacillus sediminilitoris]THF82404.1 erythromycin esterase family protein [Metabacillus sediminilitoris]